MEDFSENIHLQALNRVPSLILVFQEVEELCSDLAQL